MPRILFQFPEFAVKSCLLRGDYNWQKCDHVEKVWMIRDLDASYLSRRSGQQNIIIPVLQIMIHELI